MYEPNDTIVAVSSATSDKRAIVRISGLATLEVLQRIFISEIDISKAQITTGQVVIDNELKVDAILYLFPAPNSYTGDCLAELHIHTNSPVIERLIGNLLLLDLRMASAGEFTARAYLNGKIDLAQAEAVGEIVASSNRFQLAAAEKLLTGSLSKTANQISLSVMDLLSRIEAGLDFSGEDIEFITRSQGIEKLTEINAQLEQLLAGSISYESMIDLPSVGLAGLANAGKSSLLNKLLNRKRSIVSGERKTTRDILTGLLELAKSSCIIFDCAGLLPFDQQHNILDELAQQTAVESLQNASIVIFCVDISSADFDEDVSVFKFIEPKSLIAIATKSDLLSEDELVVRLKKLKELFGFDFLPTSSETGDNLILLGDMIDKKIISLAASPAAATTGKMLDTKCELALTARHRQAVNEAISNTNQAICELELGNDEIVAMLLRSVYSSICLIESVPVDEQVLSNIFGRFCIGK